MKLEKFILYIVIYDIETNVETIFIKERHHKMSRDCVKVIKKKR